MPKPLFFNIFSTFFHIFGPWRGQISRKKVGRFENWRGSIGKPILGLLTFGSSPDLCDSGSKLAHFAQNPPYLFFYRTSGPHYRFQQIRDVFFLLFGVLNIFFHNKKVSFSWVQLPFCVSTLRCPPPPTHFWSLQYRFLDPAV